VTKVFLSPVGFTVASFTVLGFSLMAGSMPGEYADDSPNDVSPAYADIVRAGSSLDDTNLTAYFYLRELPPGLPIDRPWVEEGEQEYGWIVEIDVDANPHTGSELGAEYSLALLRFRFLNTPIDPLSDTNNLQSDATNAPIDTNYFQANVWRYETEGRGWTNISDASLVVSDSGPDKRIELTGGIPDITASSRLYFLTWDTQQTGAVEDGTDSNAAYLMSRLSVTPTISSNRVYLDFRSVVPTVSYFVEASNDLLQWSSAGTAVQPTSQLRWDGGETGGVRKRFYRIRIP